MGISVLNEEVVSFRPPPADTYAGPNPIGIMAEANLNLETDDDEVAAVLTLTLLSDKPVPVPTTAPIVLKRTDGPKWHHISISGNFVCTTPEFLTITAECVLRWEDAGKRNEIKHHGVLSFAVPAKPEEVE